MPTSDRSALRLLLVPGGGGSGPEHWHRFWAQSDSRCSWVDQVDPSGGTRDSWVGRLDTVIRSSSRPTILIAHSLACVVVSHWAARFAAQPGDDTMGQRSGPHHDARSVVKGAMLVAPADVNEVPDLHASPYDQFVPIPMVPLPFPSVVVASTNDPLLSVDRADAIASAWGSDIDYIGEHLHVGSDARLGDWSRGRAILDQLLLSIEADEHRGR